MPQPDPYTTPLLPGGTYHVYNRGNNRDTVFFRHEDYLMFLDKWRKFIPAIAETYAFNLLPNHFHAIVRIHDSIEIAKTPDKTPPAVTNAFRKLFISYARSFQNKYNHEGAVFHSPFKRKLVSDERQLFQLIAYIHFNAYKHGIVNGRPEVYEYSSYKLLIGDSPLFLNQAAVLEKFGGLDGFIKFHQAIGIERWGLTDDSMR